MTDLIRRKIRTTAILAMGLMGTFETVGFVAQGQTSSPLPSQDTIESWLHSGEPRLEAWGAHYALITRNENLTPDLLALANEWQPLIRQVCDNSLCSELSSEQWREREAIATVLDALIQLDGHVSPDALASLAPDFPSYVAERLARLPSEESTALALQLYHSPPEDGDVLQYVAAALLAQHPPYGFAADLLASIDVHATVVVVLPGSTASGYGRGSSCGLGGTVPPPPDWPKIGQYILSTQNSDMSAVVVGGLDPLYSVRTETSWYSGEPSHVCQNGLAQLNPSTRLKLIAEMLGVSPETISWHTSFVDSVEFRSVDQVNAAILALVEDQQEKYRQTANALAERGLLTYSDVEASLPKLQFEIQDTRDPASVPLMPLPALPAGASWDADAR